MPYTITLSAAEVLNVFNGLYEAEEYLLKEAGKSRTPEWARKVYLSRATGCRLTRENIDRQTGGASGVTSPIERNGG